MESGLSRLGHRTTVVFACVRGQTKPKMPRTFCFGPSSALLVGSGYSGPRLSVWGCLLRHASLQPCMLFWGSSPRTRWLNQPYLFKTTLDRLHQLGGSQTSIDHLMSGSGASTGGSGICTAGWDFVLPHRKIAYSSIIYFCKGTRSLF